MAELMKLDGGELATTGEGDLRVLIGDLAKHLHSAAVKHDDISCEVEFATDSMGSRGRLRFRSYRRPSAAA